MGHISTQKKLTAKFGWDDHFEDLGVNWRVTIKYTFNKYGVKSVDWS
jgi:hypothetical protein